jgi:DNA-binding beta-propeller fold protein YncE
MVNRHDAAAPIASGDQLAATRFEDVARRFLRGGVGLSLLLLCLPLQGAPRVVTGLTVEPSFSLGAPTPVWAAIVDPATLSKIVDLPADQALGGKVAADLHGHRAYLTAGGGIEVIDTISNTIEALVGKGSYYSITGLAADPVRARLYASNTSPQPEIEVVDTDTLSFLPPIALPKGLPGDQGMSAPVVTPDGGHLYLLVANTLLSVRLPDGYVEQSAVLNFAPFALAVNQDRNELYVGDFGSGGTFRGVFVLDASTLATKRNFAGFGSIFAIAVRPSDSALLVEIDTGHGFADTRLEAVDASTGETGATSPGGGGGLVVSIDGKQIYRFQRDDHTPGETFSDTSSTLVVLDALTLNRIGEVALDTRAPNDPARQESAIVGTSAASIAKVSLAVEYFHAALGHYFLTSFPAEINALDTGVFIGWQRTGQSLPVYAQRADGPLGIVPVCRFYGRPEKGLDSHFYSASALECVQVQQAFGDSWILETAEAFDVYPADVATGACPFGTIPVYRVYNNRPDANHRYTTSLAIRDAMVQAGRIAEGYGPNAVAFCVPR